MIRSIAIFLFAAIAAVTLSGCLEYESRIKVRPDGSGILIETVKLNEETAEFMKSFDAEKADSITSSFFNEEELREKAAQYGEGVSYVSGKKIEENGKIGYVAVYAFTNIENLMVGRKNVAEQLPGAVDNAAVAGDSPADRFSFSFTKGDPSTLRIRVFPEEDLKKEMDEAKDKQDDMDAADLSDSLQGSYLRMMKVFMEGMKMHFIIEPEGKIVETNASNRKGSDIVLLGLDFDKLLADDKELTKLVAKGRGKAPETAEEFKEILQGIPGFTVEFGEVVIRFKE